MARVVYISYDGMAEQLGQSQVLPYVRGLAARGHTIELLSFEKAPEPLRFRERLADGLRWTALRYHRAPTVPATSFDLLQGQLALAMLDATIDAEIYHVRSYVPCLMALPLAKLRRRRLLFDTRGTWPDQKVAAGTWSADGRLYRGTKRVERALFGAADQITTLTNALRDYLRTGYPFADEVTAPITVIPTCVDLERFSTDVPATLPDPMVKTLVYVGSLGGVYLDEAVARFYLAWRRHAGPARLLIVSQQEPAILREVLAAKGVAGELVHRAARHDEVPGLLRSAHAAVSLIGQGLGFLGSAPTKIGEMLACGLPVAATPLGDVVELLQGSGAGMIVRGLTDDRLDGAALELLALASDPATPTRARALATRWFRLATAIDSYDQLYQRAGADQRWPRGSVL